MHIATNVWDGKLANFSLETCMKYVGHNEVKPLIYGNFIEKINVYILMAS